MAEFGAPEQVFAYLLVFARLGSMMMLLPALGDTSIPARVRLSLALVVSLIIYGLVGASLPTMPTGVLEMFGLLLTEIVIGLFIGGSARLLMSALHVAGTVIAYNTGLAAAQAFDPAQGAQSAIFSQFLTVLGVTLIFATNLHHLMLAAMHDSYRIFTPGMAPDVADFASLVTQTVATSFRLGIQMSAPFLVYGLVFNVGLGLVARLMPQLQVFFIAMPINILLGYAVLLIAIGSMMAWFLHHVEATVSLLLF